MLALKPGETVDFGETSTDIAPLTMIRHAFGDSGFCWRNRSFCVPEGAVLDYPLIPHNPYTQHGLPSEADYLGRLSFTITESENQMVVK